MISLFVTVASAAIVSIGARPSPEGMAIVSAGHYTPLYGPAAAGAVHVPSFALDRLPVTRAQFLAFVRSHPAWRRGVASPAVAGEHYLAEWPAALDAGTPVDLQRPVVSISIAAARAYCAAHGKRLPTTAEWELAAVAPVADVLAQYAMRTPGMPAPVVETSRQTLRVSHLHDRVWEWTADFDGSASNDHAHAAHAAGGRRAHAECASAAIGASTTTDYPAFLRNAMRATLTASSTTRNLGFRCAMSLAA